MFYCIFIGKLDGVDLMADPKNMKFLSRTEVKRLNALATHSTVKGAAQSLGIAAQTLYNWQSNLKKRYKKRRGWINSILAQTRRGGCLENLLTERNRMAPPDSEEEEWEEEY